MKNTDDVFENEKPYFLTHESVQKRKTNTNENVRKLKTVECRFNLDETLRNTEEKEKNHQQIH